MPGEMLNNFQQPDKRQGLFKKKDEPNPFTEQMENTVNRLRVLEERYTNLQSEVRVTEENMIHRNKRLSTDIKTLTMDITEIRKEINEIKDKVLLIIKEFQAFAKKDEVQILKRYIEMWEPLNFATHNEVAEIVGEKLKEKG
jgi:hypothetical protein